MRLQAILFDVDGTLAETEEAHRTAFNQAFAEAGLPWVWSQDDYRELLKVTSGQLRIRRFLETIGETAPDELIASLHRRKNEVYAALVADKQVQLRPGVARLIDEARQAGLKLAIVTTTSRVNIEALIAHILPAGAIDWFDTLVTGEDVQVTKPDPEAYTIAVARLGVPASACIAVEDSRNGLLAAQAAGIATLVTPSFYMSHEHFEGAALVCNTLDAPRVTIAELNDLLAHKAEGALAETQARP